MKNLLGIVVVLFFLLSIVMWSNLSHANDETDNKPSSMMVCKDKQDSIFFVHIPEDLLVVAFGFNGVANCLIVRDTQGTVHTMCENVPDHACIVITRKETEE